MAHLIYSAICSLDGFIEDREGRFDWAMPDEEVHGFVNDLERGIGFHLYGRRMYETMQVWETDPDLAAHAAVMGDYARIWQAAEKTVYSKTLPAVVTRKTRLERSFDPGAVRQLKAAASTDILIGGPQLAAQVFAAGLVDQCSLFLVPVALGGGKPAFPPDLRVNLALVEQRPFACGIVYLGYRVRP